MKIELKLSVRSFITFGFLSYSIISLGQLPSSDFSIPSQACLGGLIISKNAGATTQSEWDFCQGDLLLNGPIFVTPTVIPAILPIGPTLIEVNHLWYGFICDRVGQKLYRLDFGASLLNQTPTINDLGNLGSNLNSPQNIKIVEYQGNFYGFINNLSFNQLVRINFGNNIENGSVTSDILSSDPGFGNGGLDVAYDGSNWIVALSNANTITLFNLGTTPGTIVSGISSVTTSTIPGVSDIGDIKFAFDNNVWYGFIVGYSSNTIHRLTFGTSLYSNPSVQLLNVSFGSLQPYGLEIHQDDNNWIIFSTTAQGNLVRLNLGNQMTNNAPQMDDLGRYTQLLNTFKLSMAHSKSRWVGITTRWDAQTFFLIDFPQNISSFNKTYSNNADTVLFKSIAGGIKTITQYTKDSNGLSSSTTKSLEVLTSLAPTIDFNNSICFGVPVSFEIISNVPLANVAWDFNNDETIDATTANPNYSFSSLGPHSIYAKITDNSGCENQIVKSIDLYSPPTPSFSLPAASPICSNQNYLFSNTSSFDTGSGPTWQWSVNGSNIATTQNLNYLIPSTVAQNITLTASIPGCSSQSTQSITTIQDGPLANFSSSNSGCVGAPIPFTNTTSGTVTSYAWTFGDGNISSQTNTSNTYSSPGTFAVTLTAYNSAGCQNFLSKNISIYSNPQPDFVIEAPPYSCANYPAQFDNNTPPLLDSNIATWVWNFGDAANGTSNQKNPTYIFSTATTYNVTMQAISNFGCTATKQHSVIIDPSPQAAFTNSPACVDQNTQFKDASSGSITSYQWVIQNTILTGANPPPYVFKSAGTFPVSLTTTSSNGCKSQVLKNISVPIPPVMDFVFQPPCTGKPTTFQEANPGGPDPSVAWNWNFGQGSGIGSPTDYTFTTTGGYFVTLTATRTSGCIYATSKNITIYDGPVAKFTPSEQAGATPLTVTFNNESKADSYFWEFDSGNSTSNEVSPVFTYNELGEYKVLLIASNIHGCIDTVSTKIYVIIPQVDLAMKNFLLVEDPSSNSSKPVVTILNLGNIPLTNPEVQIDLGGNAVLKEKIISTILPGKSIQQTLSLEIVPQTLKYICAEVAPAGDVNVYNDRRCLSLTDTDVLFYPYPNPAKGQINFDWISAENENVAVTIYKSTGQVAFQQNFQLVQSGINQLAIDISSLSSGLYLIHFSGAKSKKTFSVSVIN